MWNCAVADHLDAQRVLVGVEHLEFAVALVLAEEGDAGGQDDGDHDGQALDRGMVRRHGQADEEAARRPRRTAGSAPSADWRRTQATTDDGDGHDAEGDAGRDGLRLEQIDEHRQQGRGEQDLDDRLVELVEELLPQRLARQRRQPVGAEAPRLSGDRVGDRPFSAAVGQCVADLAERAHGESAQTTFTTETQRHERQTSNALCRLVSIRVLRGALSTVP